jgi:hypothetical protein
MSVAIQLKLENELVATTEVAKPGLESLRYQNKAQTMGFLSLTHSKFQS